MPAELAVKISKGYALILLILTPFSALQSYFIFSIGNITPIFQETYKVCA